MRSDPASFHNFANRVRDGSLLMGRDIDITPKLKNWLTETGFVDVVERQSDVP